MYLIRKYRKRKYGNVSTLYRGVVYDSKAEAQYAMYLDSEKKQGKIKTWERQKKIELAVNEKKICNYFIDFVVHHKDGKTEFIEIKGMKLAVWKLKWKLFEALYTDDNYILTVIEV